MTGRGCIWSDRTQSHISNAVFFLLPLSFIPIVLLDMCAHCNMHRDLFWIWATQDSTLVPADTRGLARGAVQ